MQTYKYQFPASGKIDPYNLEAFTKALENNLNDGPECLMAYCIFPTDSDILDKVTFDMDNDGNVDAVNMHTYTELWEGMEYDLKDCMETNLASAMDEFAGVYKPEVTLAGEVQALGRQGDIPKTLYHITERKDLDTILNEGLVPKTGDNNYKNMEDKVFLASEKDLAPWLAVLKHKDDPVILEVDNENLDIETGRVFKDRAFVEGGKYGEYSTTEPIPASSVKVADLSQDSELAEFLRRSMVTQLEHTKEESEINEVKTGLSRLAGMGIMEEEKVNALVKNHTDILQHLSGNTSSDTSDDEGLPWDENDAGRDPAKVSDDVELPWDEDDAGRGLTMALAEMPPYDDGQKL